MVSWAELWHTLYFAWASWAELCHTFYFAMRNKKYDTAKNKTNNTGCPAQWYVRFHVSREKSGLAYRVFGNKIILKWSRQSSKSGCGAGNFTGTYLDLLITSESYCKDPTF